MVKNSVSNHSKKRKTTCNYGPTNMFIVQTPIGNINVISCPKGLHSVLQESSTDLEFIPDLRCEVRPLSQKWEDNGYTYKPVKECIEWLSIYFSDPKKLKNHSHPPFCSTIAAIDGSFQKRVWEKLANCVPPGETISYGSLAKLVDGEKSSAAQAVGTAMKSNPLQLIIPCHRVINSNGNIGNYKGGKGNNLKLWLLQHEGYNS